MYSNRIIVTQDNLGRIWLATHNGITLYNSSVWKYYDVTNDLPANDYSIVKTDDSGTILGYYEGGEFFKTKHTFRLIQPDSKEYFSIIANYWKE